MRNSQLIGLGIFYVVSIVAIGIKYFSLQIILTGLLYNY